MNKLIYLLSLTVLQNTYAFDLEDYATTFRLTRDAHAKADRELLMAERSLIDIISGYGNVLPLDVSSLHKTGSGTQSRECSYQENCSKARSPETVLAEFSELANDPSVRTFFSAKSYSEEDTSWRLEILDNAVTHVQNYYDNMSSTKIADESVLFNSPKTSTVWDEDTLYMAYNLGLPDPFMNSSEDLFTEFRSYRDQYLKALNEWKLSLAPWRAAQAAWAAATRTYYNNPTCTGARGMITVDEWIALGSPDYNTYLESLKPPTEENGDNGNS
jgi:hypothetical protein